ncbi:response regulator [Fibrobacterota bacterium]
MTNQNTEHFEIVMIEDDPGDADLTREILEQTALPINLTVMEDGSKAIAHLRKKSVPAPDLILLDLNLPGNDGLEILSEIKTDSGLRSVPVIILTTSTAENDVAKSYSLGCNSYLSKPVGLMEFSRMIKSIMDYWLVLVRLPKS